jgi:hypothetical protein
MGVYVSAQDTMQEESLQVLLHCSSRSIVGLAVGDAVGLSVCSRRHSATHSSENSADFPS